MHKFFSPLMPVHATVTTFLCLPTKDKPRMLGIGGPFLFPDCQSDGKKSHNMKLTRQECLCGLLVEFEHISSPLPSAVTCDMSCQLQKAIGLGTSAKWSVTASQPDEELEQKIRVCRYGRRLENNHNIRRDRVI